MFRHAATSFIPLAALCCAAEPPAAALPGTHQEFIPALLELLTQTEQCLGSCTDAATTEAALPELNKLAAKARELSAHQATLPEPTVQDYMAAHPHVGDFNRLWESIGSHIERLEKAGLMSPELRSVLQIAPSEAPNKK